MEAILEAAAVVELFARAQMLAADKPQVSKAKMRE